ncbi:hypothetical protein JCM11491_002953 [Sporobolomyces phaffii]
MDTRGTPDAGNAADESQRISSSLSSLHLSTKPRVMSHAPKEQAETAEITYRAYRGEQDLEHIVGLVDDELSEPYNLYTYRYFLDQWPHLCFFAFSGSTPLGVIISKVEPHTKSSDFVVLDPAAAWHALADAGGGASIDPETGEKRRYKMRGYLAMLSVKKGWRGKGIATHLLRISLTTMLNPPSRAAFPRDVDGVSPERFLFPPDEFVLETESDNAEALGFYGKMGFVREKELYRFYLNGKRAARLKLDLRGLVSSPSSSSSPPP